MSEDGRSSLPPDQMRIKVEKEQEKSYANRLWIIQYLYKKELEGEQNIADEQLSKFLSVSEDVVQKELRILRKIGLVEFEVVGSMFLDVELTGTAIDTIEQRLPNYVPPLDTENKDAEYNELRLKIIKEENKGKKLDLIIELVSLPTRAGQLWNHFFGSE